ncbi:hypothetical protein FRIGORI9N_400141 [Frigoribacterium sp. 9N]|nr:hypothetical protein FRIGORI9N_400141 [Frigoribacterium sp. 9N]
MDIESFALSHYPRNQPMQHSTSSKRATNRPQRPKAFDRIPKRKTYLAPQQASSAVTR